jgi:hypothetical protein
MPTVRTVCKRRVVVRLIEPSTPRARTGQLEELELRTSQQLVAIIDILLGLTLVEGALAFKGMFTEGSTINFPAALALVLVYYTAIRSFADWHIAMELRPYRILTDKVRSWELPRVFLDFAIMASYSFLILRAHVLIRRPGSDMTIMAATYVVIYLAYVLWGELRQKADPVGRLGAKPFSRHLLGVTFVVALVLFGLYFGLRGHGRLGMSRSTFNVSLLLLELALIWFYRHKNWSQQIVLNGPEAHRESVGKRFIQTITKEKAAAIAARENGVERRKQIEALQVGAEKVDEALLGKLIESTHGR